MLRRDFTKTNKEYFNKNKIILISIAVFLIIGLVIGIIFGMNGNFELKGYNEFAIQVTEQKAKDYSKHTDKIEKILNDYNADVDTISVTGQGDETFYIVRYMNDITEKQEIEINKLIAEELVVSADNVDPHHFVNPIVENKDYIYTAVSILLIIVVASIFAYIRYNAASALAIIIACLVGTAGFMSIETILRLQIGMSYFALLVILNMLIVYMAFNLFESMHKSSWLMADEYDNAITSALKASKFRTLALTIALMVIGLLFVLIAPSTIKYASINIMFMAVTVLAAAWYIIPFVWSVFITRCRKRVYKVKATDVENKKEKTN